MNKLRQLRVKTQRFLSRIRAQTGICRIPTSPIASIPLNYAWYSVLSGAINDSVAVKQIALNTILEKSIKFDNYFSNPNCVAAKRQSTCRIWQNTKTISLLKIRFKNQSLLRRNASLYSFPAVYQFSNATTNPQMHGIARKYSFFALS